MLPLSLKLVNENIIDMQTLVRVLCNAPAKILKCSCGSLTVGAPADICIIDTEETWQLNAETMKSRGKNTPFLDWDFMGRCVYSVVDGEIKHSL